MAEETEIYQKSDLPNQAFPVLEDIRRQGKLCDVTLKVNVHQRSSRLTRNQTRKLIFYFKCCNIRINNISDKINVAIEIGAFTQTYRETHIQLRHCQLYLQNRQNNETNRRVEVSTNSESYSSRHNVCFLHTICACNKFPSFTVCEVSPVR